MKQPSMEEREKDIGRGLLGAKRTFQPLITWHVNATLVAVHDKKHSKQSTDPTRHN